MASWLVQFNLINNSFIMAKWVFVGLVISLAWLMGQQFFQYLVPVPVLNQPSLTSGISKQNTSIQPIVDSSAIYLLGNPSITAVPSLAKTTSREAVSETKLNLQVLGILAISGERGVVIIKVGSRTIVVSTGERIQSGVTLTDVYPSYILIDHNGVSEKLLLEDSNTLIEQVESDESRVGLTQGMHAKLSEMSQQIRKSPMKIASYVRFDMLSNGKQITSIKVWPKKDVALFKALGFKAGDEIKTINNRSIKEMGENPAVWQNLLKQTVFELEVMRNGESTSFVVDMN